MFNDQADEDLMVMYQQGEVRAFETLLGRHRKSVYNFILRFVGDKETAEDLLQETFMRVIKGADAYKRQAKFTTWLYTIARNLCVDQTRRRKHRRHASLDAPMDTSDSDKPAMPEENPPQPVPGRIESNRIAAPIESAPSRKPESPMSAECAKSISVRSIIPPARLPEFQE